MARSRGEAASSQASRAVARRTRRTRRFYAETRRGQPRPDEAALFLAIEPIWSPTVEFPRVQWLRDSLKLFRSATCLLPTGEVRDLCLCVPVRSPGGVQPPVRCVPLGTVDEVKVPSLPSPRTRYQRQERDGQPTTRVLRPAAYPSFGLLSRSSCPSRSTRSACSTCFPCSFRSTIATCSTCRACDTFAIHPAPRLVDGDESGFTLRPVRRRVNSHKRHDATARAAQNSSGGAGCARMESLYTFVRDQARPA